MSPARFFIIKRLSHLHPVHAVILSVLCALLLSFIIWPLTPSNAQDTTNTTPAECPSLTAAALATLQDNCAAMGGSMACIGGHTIIDLMDSNVLLAGGESAALADVVRVSTLPFDADTGATGIAVLTVPANIPRSLSEQGIKMILVGDTVVENAVSLENALVPVDPITVRAVVGSNLRSFPSTDGRIVTSVGVGTELVADGVNNDGTWLRVLHNDQAAWISRQIVSITAGDASTLPIWNDDARTLMQAFYLQNGDDAPLCQTVTPAFLLLQAPGRVSASIEVNGVPVRFTSTLALTVAPDNTMRLYSVMGGANSGGVSVPAGFTMSIQLSADGRNADGLWTGLRPITSAERGLLNAVFRLPDGVMHERVRVPSQEDVTLILQEINRASTQTGGTSTGALNCSGFQPTSPLDAIINGQTIFYWDGVDGATSYRVRVYDDAGNIIATRDIDGFNTTLTMDTSSTAIGNPGGFAWDIAALLNGTVACTTGRVSVIRDNSTIPVANPGGSGGGDDNEPAPEPTPCLWEEC